MIPHFRRIKNEKILFAIAILFAFLVGLGLSELFLRAFVFDPSQRYIHKPGWKIIFSTELDQLPGITGDSIIHINSLGLRGEPPSQTSLPMIAAIGGSTTQDIMLSDDEMWTSQLQTLFRKCFPKTWIGNAGKAGTNGRHHAMQLEVLTELIPNLDTALIMIGLNDMLYDFRIHHPQHLSPNWDLAQAFMYLPPKDAVSIERSAVWQTLLPYVENFERLFDGQGTLVKKVEFGAITKQYRERRQVVHKEDWIQEIPDMTHALRIYHATLTKILDIALNSQIRLIFLTQPYLWHNNMSTEEIDQLYAGGTNGVDQWFQDPHNPWYTPLVMRNMLAAYNKVLRSFCQKNKLACIDLERDVPKKRDLFYDDFHFSEKGAATIGRIVARQLIPECISQDN